MNNQTILDLYQQERDKRSQELFNKNENELTIDELMILEEYLYDLKYPEWRPVYIKGINKNSYLINSIGQVKSLIRNKNGKFLNHTKNHDGYNIVTLCNNTYRRTISIHRLVAQAFIPNPENKPQVNHKNGKKDFNWVGNLEWVTGSENVKHAFSTGLNKIGYGVNNPNNKFTEKQVHEVCKLLEKGFNTVKIVSIYPDLTIGMVNNIKGKRCWLNISEQYCIPDRNKRIYRSSDIKEKIKYLINRNIDYSDIIEKVGLSKTIENRKYISGIKYSMRLNNELIE